jgi:hypothetical protein
VNSLGNWSQTCGRVIRTCFRGKILNFEDEISLRGVGCNIPHSKLPN